MAFTYVDTLLTDRDKVRFEIGDVVEDSGPRPSGLNFSDHEIAAIVTAEGSFGRASARLCEILATQWAGLAGSVSMADYSENYTARAEYWRKRAQDLRTTYGGSRAGAQSAPTRIDGYSDDVAADAT